MLIRPEEERDSGYRSCPECCLRLNHRQEANLVDVLRQQAHPVILACCRGSKYTLVLAWTELHQEELMNDWNLVMNGEEPFKIQPLQ